MLYPLHYRAKKVVGNNSCKMAVKLLCVCVCEVMFYRCLWYVCLHCQLLHCKILPYAGFLLMYVAQPEITLDKKDRRRQLMWHL